MKSNQLNPNSSPDQSKDASQTVFKNLSEYLFDGINFVSFPFSQARQVSGNDLVPVTDQSSFWGTSRLTDTAEGKFLSPGKSSRMRCNFYLENPAETIGYLLSPAVFDSFGSLTEVTDEPKDLLRAYIGLKFDEGDVSIVVKEAGGAEVEHPAGIGPFTGSFTTTYVLEIKHFISYAEVLIDNVLVGSFSADFVGNNSSVSSFVHLYAPVKSVTGSEVNLVVENYQFIQDR